MRRFRVKDRSGRTIGYLEEEPGFLDSIVGFILLLFIAPVILLISGLYFGVSAVWNLATRVPITPAPHINGLIVMVVLSVIVAVIIRSLPKGRANVLYIDVPIGTKIFYLLNIHGKIYTLTLGFIIGALITGFAVGIGMFFFSIPLGWLLESQYEGQLYRSDRVAIDSNSQAPMTLLPMSLVGLIWIILAGVSFLFERRDTSIRSRENFVRVMTMVVLLCSVAPIVGMILLMVLQTHSWNDFVVTSIDDYREFQWFFSNVAATILGGAVVGLLTAPFVMVKK